MVKGSVVSVYLGASASGALRPVIEVKALAWRGLEGDRYALGTGTYSNKPGPDREVTLIESEALESLASEHGIALKPGESRRNIVTRGVRLDDLIGKEFRVGEVRLRGIRRCDPCAHLESLTQPGVLRGLVARGGLRASVVEGGTFRVGDAIELVMSTGKVK